MTLESIEEIVALLEEHPVAEIEIEEPGRRILVRKGSFAPPAAIPSTIENAAPEAVNTDSSAPITPAEEEAPHSVLLTAPMVGVFHHHNPPVRYGSTVQLGQTVGYIEALKLMNEVAAQSQGRVTEVLEDNTPVGYGQPLFRLEPV